MITDSAIMQTWANVHNTHHIKDENGHYLDCGMSYECDCEAWPVADTACPFCTRNKAN